MLSAPEFAEGVEYEYVNYLYANCRLLLLHEYGMWCHILFTAKPKNAGAPLVNFFAELNDPGERKFRLNVYSSLDPTDPGELCFDSFFFFFFTKKKKIIIDSCNMANVLFARNMDGCGMCPFRRNMYPMFLQETSMS